MIEGGGGGSGGSGGGGGGGAPMRGVLKILDDECLVGQGSDAGFANKLYQQLGGGSMGKDGTKSHSRFSVTHTQRVEHRFEIAHYAGAVVYSTAGFIEKNKDTLFPEARARGVPRASREPFPSL